MFVYKYMRMKKYPEKYINQIVNKDKRVGGNHAKKRKDGKNTELTKNKKNPKKHNMNDMILFICVYKNSGKYKLLNLLMSINY